MLLHELQRNCFTFGVPVAWTRHSIEYTTSGERGLYCSCATTTHDLDIALSSSGARIINP